MSDGGDKSFLASASCYPGFVVLLCTDTTVYLSGPASLWELDQRSNTPKRLARLPFPWPHRQAAGWRYLRRLARLDLRGLIQVPGGNLLGIIQKKIISIQRDSGETRCVFQVSDGGRPNGFALTSTGHLFVGEYWGNPRRQSLRIWASDNAGENWELAHTLPANSAKHIHNLVWDPFRQGVWVLTGDGDNESALLFSPDEFKTVNEVVRGGQIYRACRLFCLPEGLYYGTDTERDQNWFVHLEVEHGRVHKIIPLPSSCLSSAYMAGQYFISTAVEPSKVNYYRKAVLWSSSNLYNWSKRVEFEKDWLPGEYFYFGIIVLPQVQKSFSKVIFSTLALKKHDLTTFIANNL